MYVGVVGMSESDFARRELKKCGWTDGCGLGRHEDGIKDAIKVKIKKNLHGVGHNVGREFTFHWWDHAFNKAADSIRVETSEDGVTVTKSQEEKKTSKDVLYGNFVKGGTLLDNKEEIMPTNDDAEHDSEEEWDRNRPSEEQVFQLCGGRTAHKAARFGHKLNGKLKRIEEQEQKNLSSLAGETLENERTVAEKSNHDGCHGGSKKIRKKNKKERRKDKKIKENLNCVDKKDHKQTEKTSSEEAEMLSKKEEITKSDKSCERTNQSLKSRTNKLITQHSSNKTVDDLSAPKRSEECLNDVHKDVKKRKKEKKKKLKHAHCQTEGNENHNGVTTCETNVNSADLTSVKEKEKIRGHRKDEDRKTKVESLEPVAKEAGFPQCEESRADKPVKKSKKHKRRHAGELEQSDFSAVTEDAAASRKKKKTKTKKESKQEQDTGSPDTVKPDPLCRQDSSGN
ncbi:G patch domain-containing protein 4-like isoform X2 [Gigantopelta aegis]|uniref:G patch domain-containing protein 4-like isoform X2 n=1 Tax=Gigantopelta aegis TaxID=1735272 RepID=UPI001B88AAA5|nr:G patch domain-containing protein 4-like isoform X2 [Gigantopelta aegis]